MYCKGSNRGGIADANGNAFQTPIHRIYRIYKCPLLFSYVDLARLSFSPLAK